MGVDLKCDIILEKSKKVLFGIDVALSVVLKLALDLGPTQGLPKEAEGD